MADDHSIEDRDSSPGSCVAEVMGTDLFTVTPDTAAAAALRFAASRNVKHFLVVDDGSLTGIVCDTDLAVAGRDKLVSDCMKTPVLCISPETTLEEAAGIMEENAVGCLPVVTGAFLVGVITRDRLNDLDVHTVTTDVDDDRAHDNATCVSCGATERVCRDFRSNFIPLCADCLVPAKKNSEAN